MASTFLSRVATIIFALAPFTVQSASATTSRHSLEQQTTRDLHLESAAGFEGEDPTLSETYSFLEGLKKGEQSWDKFFNTGLASRMAWGVILSGPKPYQLNSDAEMIPASLTKIFVAGAVLKYKNSNERIATAVTWQARPDGSAENVTIIGSGDPTWGVKEFNETLTTRADEVAAVLRSNGVQTVHGPIEVKASDPRWNIIKRHPGWKDSFGTQCSAALAQAINLNSNCARFLITSPRKGRWIEAGVPVEVNLDLKLGSSTQIEVQAVDNIDVDSYSYKITGTIAEGASRTFYLPIHRSADWFKNLLTEALVRAQIVHQNQKPEPVTTFPRLSVVYSTEIHHILKPYLKESNNFLGDALFKYLAGSVLVGAKMTTGSIADAGRALLFEYTREVGNGADASEFYDGSGLSYSNRVSAKGVLSILEYLQRDEEFDLFLDWLPIAGVDGTLKERMRGTAAYNNLRAKTGSLDKVSNLAGYVSEMDGKGQITGRIPFVILSATAGYTTASRTVQNKVGAALSALVKEE